MGDHSGYLVRGGAVAALLLGGLCWMLSTAPVCAAPDSHGAGCPRIVHAPVTTVVRGIPAQILAHIDCADAPVPQGNLYVKFSLIGKPAPIRMRAAGNTAFEGLVPVSMLQGISRFWYYVEGVSKDGVTNQTPWYPVRVIQPDTLSAGLGAVAATGAESSPSLLSRPWTWAGIAVLAGGGAAIAANQGGDGSGGSDEEAPAPSTPAKKKPRHHENSHDDDNNGGGGFDPSDVVTISAVGTATGGYSGIPQDQVIDGTALVGARTVQGIRCTLSYNAYSVPDQFQIIYEGNVIFDSGDISGSGVAQPIAAGTSPQVMIRVITATGGTAWDWTALLEISVRD